VISLLDLNVDLDLALDLAAPVDLAVAANANIAAPIDAAVSANVLSLSSNATALADQGVMIDQTISGEAIANAPQDTVVDQTNDVIDAGSDAALAEGTDGAPDTGLDSGAVAVPTDDSALADSGTNPLDNTSTSVVEGTLDDGNLLNVNVDVAADADVTAPIAGAVAANANIAAPIDAAVAANVGSVGSEATAVADQDAIITQNLDGVVAEATADQQAEINQ
jgi:hypothetical protein